MQFLFLLILFDSKRSYAMSHKRCSDDCSAYRSNELTPLKWSSYLILMLAWSPQFIDTARALAIILSPFCTNCSDFLLFFVVHFLLAFWWRGGDASMWQHSAKLFYFLSSHVFALLHIVMSLFANFSSFFFCKERKIFYKNKTFYYKSYVVHASPDML